MTNFFDAQTVDIIIRLCMALVFGMIIGTERILAHKTAGMRTYALVSMGSALFIIISILVANSFANNINFDPLRVAAQIISATGFICAGLVFVRKDGITTGLTSSVGLWVSVGIGMASGFGLYKLALITTILTLFIFIVLWFVEARLKKTRFFKNIPNE